MTELQKVELEILREFDSVCRQLGVTYFLVCGSALGAVKYGGFIPWDDDIDVAMYREDYKIFVEKAPEILPNNLFLQNYYSDPAFPQVFSKLRNSQTTYIEKSVASISMNHGIFIDIFPLDGFPEGKWQAKWLMFRKRVFDSMLLSVCEVPRQGLARLTYPVFHILGVRKRTAKIAAMYEKMISAFPVAGSKIICNHGNWQGVLDHSFYWHFGMGAKMKFEDLEVFVPEQYDTYLRQKYGDYQQELPESEKCGHHYYTVCDCNQSYTKYIEKMEV